MDNKEYLKKVLQLESLKLEQELELKAIANQYDFDIDKIISDIPKPVMQKFEKKVTDNKGDYFSSFIGDLFLSLLGVLIFIGLIFLLKYATGFGFFLAFVATMGLLVLDIYGFICCIKNFSNYWNEPTFSEKLRYYKKLKEKQLAIYKEDYEKEMAKYNEKVQQLKNILEQKQNSLKEKYTQLSELHNQTTEALDNLYSLDIIYPKYRNIIAVSSISEYFDSGRCDSFTGPNGAYNMYKDELKQNLIINNLESINDNLESIKNNQYSLYEIMNDNLGYYNAINREITNTDSQILDLTNTTKRLEEMQSINQGAIAFIAMQNLK